MPNNNTVARAYVQIVPSAEGIKGSITSALGGEASSAGSQLGSMLSTGIKGAVVAGVAGLGAIIGGALTEGGALEQSIGGVETLFKDSASDVIAAANNAYETAGVSANSYMEQVTSFSATLLQGLGGDTEAAASYADKAIVQMADNANKMGTDIASIQYAYQGFAKDNYTMLDNLKLGYGGTQAEMARLINDSGVLGDSIEVTAETVKDVPFSSIIDAIQVIQDNLGITGTTAKEAATTLTGSFASVKAALSNVLAGLTLGQDLGPSLNALSSTLTTFLTGNLLPAVWNILSALPGALVTFITTLGPQLAAGLQGIIPQITSGLTAGLPQLLQSGAGMVQNVMQGITTTLPQMLQSGVQIVTTAIQGFSEQYPTILQSATQTFTAIVEGISQILPQVAQAALDVVGSFLSMVVENLPSILNAGAEMLASIVEGIGNSLPQIVSSAVEMLAQFLQTIVQNLPDIIAAGFDLLVSLIEGIGNAIPNLITAAGDIVSTIWDTITNIDWMQLGKDIISGLINGIGAMGSALWDAATNIASSALDAIKSFFGIASPSKLMQFEIGPYIPQGLALGIEKNANFVTDAMDDLSARSYASMRQALPLDVNGQAVRALQQDAQIRRDPRPATQGRNGQTITLDDLTRLVTLVVQAIQENGGPVIIGDETIYRSYNRARQSQAIVTGGLV